MLKANRIYLAKGSTVIPSFSAHERSSKLRQGAAPALWHYKERGY